MELNKFRFRQKSSDDYVPVRRCAVPNNGESVSR